MLGVHLEKNYCSIYTDFKTISMCSSQIHGLMDRMFIKITKLTGDFSLLKIQYSVTFLQCENINRDQHRSLC